MSMSDTKGIKHIYTLSKCPGEMHPVASPVDKFSEIATSVPSYASHGPH